MAHLLVNQLRFARSEMQRCLAGVSEQDGIQCIKPMNCISWIIGHMAAHENWCWVRLAQGRTMLPGLYELVGYGQSASTPPLAEMWEAWRSATIAADPYLDTLTPEILDSHFEREGEPLPENIGTMLLRNIYHYWFHIGEAHAIRQQLGHANLPEFVGDMDQAVYHPSY